MTEALRIISPLSVNDAQAAQQHAADPRSSIWVNASAGSGKTTVLTNRVMRLLLDGVPPQRILCLTYTRAAAAEMSIRLADRLGHWATCSENDLNKSISDLQNAPPEKGQMTTARKLFATVLSCPGGMRIRTIHAFAQEILRRFPIEASLPPHFALIEEGDAVDVQEQVLRQMLKQPAAALRIVIDALGEKAFREALNTFLHARARLQSALDKSGSFDDLNAARRQALGLPEGVTEESLRREALDNISEAEMHDLGQCLLKGTQSAIETGKTLLAWLEGDVQHRHKHFDDYCDLFLNKSNEPRGIRSKSTHAEFPELAATYQREAERLQKIMSRIELCRIAAISEAVTTTGFDFIRRYQAMKAQRAALDYDDLIDRARDLLKRPGIAPWVLFKLDGGLDHILVDEAQDTSRAQWDIVSALAEEFFAGRGTRADAQRTLFVVGDEKQSIYSFQNADPEAFAAMRAFFAQRITDAGCDYDEVPLNVSFRSAPAILRAVDQVFTQDRARAGVSQTPVRHTSFHAKRAGRVEVWPLLVHEKMPAELPWQLPLHYEDGHDPAAALAAKIAKTIQHWLTTGRKLPGESTPIAAGDIMILLQRRRRFADLMVRALKQHHVPVTGVDRMHLMQQIVVKDLLALINFCLLPEDDLNLACILRGPLIGIREEQLMDLTMGRQQHVWSILYAKRHEPAYAAIVKYLAGWLNQADFLSPYAMLTGFLTDACPASAISGRYAIAARLGHDALDPIEELLNAAQNFSRQHAPSLQVFLHWLSQSDETIKREMDRGSGEVRIMTVHGAKGLEAPIVFLPDAPTMPRAQVMSHLHWIDDAIPVYMPQKPVGEVVLKLWQQARDKQLAENRRLLYVAMTRPARELYVGGTMPARAGDMAGSWYDLIVTALKAADSDADAGKKIETIILEDPVLPAAPTASVAAVTKTPPPLPAWAHHKAQTEKPLQRADTPSQLIETALEKPDEVFQRGLIIHRLLQGLPDVADDQREPITSKFLAQSAFGLSPLQQREIGDEVLSILRHAEYQPLFGSNSRAEIPLAGILDGQALSGQVDRLCVMPDSVWIVDYKTNRHVPEDLASIPSEYIAQLAAYHRLLQAVYPDKSVRCFLLFTAGPKLVEVPAAMLTS